MSHRCKKRCARAAPRDGSSPSAGSAGATCRTSCTSGPRRRATARATICQRSGARRSPTRASGPTSSAAAARRATPYRGRLGARSFEDDWFAAPANHTPQRTVETRRYTIVEAHAYPRAELEALPWRQQAALYLSFFQMAGFNRYAAASATPRPYVEWLVDLDAGAAAGGLALRATRDIARPTWRADRVRRVNASAADLLPTAPASRFPALEADLPLEYAGGAENPRRGLQEDDARSPAVPSILSRPRDCGRASAGTCRSRSRRWTRRARRARTR